MKWIARLASIPGMELAATGILVVWVGWTAWATPENLDDIAPEAFQAAATILTVYKLRQSGKDPQQYLDTLHRGDHEESERFDGLVAPGGATPRGRRDEREREGEEGDRGHLRRGRAGREEGEATEGAGQDGSGGKGKKNDRHTGGDHG